MFLLLQRNKPMPMHVFSLLQTKLGYMFWAVYSNGVSTNNGLPSLILIFGGDASLYGSCMF